MLQVNVLRQKPDWAKERLAFKNFKQPELVDEIIALDDERKKLQAELDDTKAKANKAAKEIGIFKSPILFTPIPIFNKISVKF